MSAISRARCVAASLLAALLAAGGVAAADLPVRYRSATAVYLEGGSAQGLAVGDRLLVTSAGQVVGELEVVFVAEHSASCRVVRETRPVRAGDLASPVGTGPAAVPASPAPAASPRAAASPPPAVLTAPVEATPTPPRWARVRGGVTLGYYRVWDRSPSALDFEQRTARLDAGLWDIAGRPYSLTVRASSRQDTRARTLSSFAPADQRDDRLFEAALRYDPPQSRLGFEVGRIGVSRFVGFGYLDGALARLRVARDFQVGGFYGRRSDLDGLGFPGSGTKYGGFLRYSPGGRYSMTGAEATLAVVRELALDDVSREYVSLESRLGRGARWSVFQRAEVDLNRGWRETLSGRQYQLSNLSLSGTVRLSTGGSASLSYDNRRNYRTHLNRSVPESVFDDLMHQGFRASVNVGRAWGPSFNASVGVRLKEQETAGTYSVSAGVRHGDLWSRSLSLGLDAAGYSNAYTDGALVGVRAGKRLQGGHSVDLSYGGSFYRLKSQSLRRTTHWVRGSGHVQLPRGLYLSSDLEYGLGDDLSGPRGLAEVGWRF